jgi:hypothetical protein
MNLNEWNLSNYMAWILSISVRCDLQRRAIWLWVKVTMDVTAWNMDLDFAWSV